MLSICTIIRFVGESRGLCQNISCEHSFPCIHNIVSFDSIASWALRLIGHYFYEGRLSIFWIKDIILQILKCSDFSSTGAHSHIQDVRRILAWIPFSESTNIAVHVKRLFFNSVHMLQRRSEQIFVRAAKIKSSARRMNIFILLPDSPGNSYRLASCSTSFHFQFSCRSAAHQLHICSRFLPWIRL